MTNEPEKKEGFFRKNYLWMIGFTGLAIISIAAYFYRSQFDGSLSTRQEVWGQFGDFMGGTLNPILAFLSLIALLVTIKIQSDELKATRAELELTRTTIEDQTSIQDEQRLQMEKQFFDNHFFNSLELLMKQREAIEDRFKTMYRGGHRSYAYEMVLKDLRSEVATRAMLPLTELDIEELRNTTKFWPNYSSSVNGFYIFTIDLLEEVESSHNPELYRKRFKSIFDAYDFALIAILGVLYFDYGHEQLDQSNLLKLAHFDSGFQKILSEIYPRTFGS